MGQVVTGFQCKECGCRDADTVDKGGRRTLEVSHTEEIAPFMTIADGLLIGDDTALHPSVLNHQLLCAARDGYAAVLQWALSSGASPETRRPFCGRWVGAPRSDPTYALHEPALLAFREQAPSKATSAKREEGLTPLMYTCRGGYIDCVNKLLRVGAQVDARDEDGLSPLHLVSAAAALDCAESLLHRANALQEDHYGRTYLDFLPDEVTLHPSSLRRWRELRAQPGPALEASGDCASSKGSAPGRATAPGTASEEVGTQPGEASPSDTEI